MKKEYIKYLVEEMHTSIIATNDKNGLPVTCVIDLMDYDDQGIYFLTATGKKFYERLVDQKYLALSALKGEDTMSSRSFSLRGKVEEIGPARLAILFSKNKYMYEIYPTEVSRKALTVFRIYDAACEWFDLSKKPIERANFTIGHAKSSASGYFVSPACIGCQKCLAVCPEECIDMIDDKAFIRQNNCLHCGNCFRICPVKAIIKE